MQDLCSQDTPTADRNGWNLPRPQPVPVQIEVAPGTLALLSKLLPGNVLLQGILDAYLADRGHDTSRTWTLRLTGAVIVADEGSEGQA